MKLGDTIKITGHYVRISRSPKPDVTIYEWKFLCFPEPKWGIFLGYERFTTAARAGRKCSLENLSKALLSRILMSERCLSAPVARVTHSTR
jgi:hypothetical protein